jgi:hypothetical protein
MSKNQDRKTTKIEVDELLDQLVVAVARQLVLQVESGENLRAAIDFLRLNKRTVTEAEIIGASQDPNKYLDSLIEDLGAEIPSRRRT